MSLASERLVIPITAKDKARVERKAAMAGRAIDGRIRPAGRAQL